MGAKKKTNNFSTIQSVPKGYNTEEIHERRICEFMDAIRKGKIKLPDTGTIVVTKFQNQKFVGVWPIREEYERWHLKYQLDIMVESESLDNDLSAMMFELTNSSLADCSTGAHHDDLAEFDIQLLQ